MLGSILLCAFALRLGLAVAWPSLHHPDELYQYLEQGHRLAFGYGIVPWEFRDGTRSWLLPGVLAGLMKAVAGAGGGVAAYMAVIAGVLSALSLAIVAAAWLWARHLAGPTAAIAAVWFELVHFGAKPLTVAVATTTLFWAAYLFLGTPRRGGGPVVGAGLLLGLSLVLRLQVAPAILLIAGLGLLRHPPRRWTGAAVAGAVVVLAAGLLGWVTWGTPFQSLWLNLKVNLIDGKAAGFGVQPWYGYASHYAHIWSGFAPLFALLVLLGTADVCAAIKRAWPAARRPVTAAVAFWALTSAVLFVGDRFSVYQTKYAAEIAVYADLRRDGNVCGVGLVDLPWHSTAGYTYLHRNLPIHLLDATDLEAARDGFNAALARPSDVMATRGFIEQACYGRNEVCLYVRDGGCLPKPAFEINRVLAERGE